MTDYQWLKDRLDAREIPVLATRVGDFLLYSSLLNGYLTTLARGLPLEARAADIRPDESSLDFLQRLAEKSALSAQERDFLDYYKLTEDARKAIVSAVQNRVEESH